MKPNILLQAALVLGLASCALAQDRLEFHSCTADLGGGLSWAEGNDSKGLNSPGWVLQAAGGFATGKRLAFIVDFLFQQDSIRAGALKEQMGSPAGGKARFESTLLEPTWIVGANRRANVYVLGGFGWFHRSVKFTNPGDTLTNPGNLVEGKSSANSGAFDGGVGVNIRLGKSNVRAFVEGRVIHGLTRNIDSTITPLTGGIRW
jgi:hypothetical protein